MAWLSSNSEKIADQIIWRDNSLAALLGINVNLFNIKLSARGDGLIESFELIPIFEGENYWLPCLDAGFNIHAFRKSIDKNLLEGRAVPVPLKIAEQLREMQRVLLREYFKPYKPADRYLDFMIEHNYGLTSLAGIKEKLANAPAA